SPVGDSTFTTSAPRSARILAACATAEAPHRSLPLSSTTRMPSSGRVTLAAAAREDLRPRLRLHERLAPRDLVVAEPVAHVDLVDRIDGPHEVVLVTERHCRVDRHAAFEASVHRGPLRVAGGEPLLGDERLP